MESVGWQSAYESFQQSKENNLLCGSGTLISPSPPEFQAVTQYMGHTCSSVVIFVNDVSVTFILSM